MRRYVLPILLLSTVAAGCRAGDAAVALASEPPAPLIEPDLGPGAGLVDSRADALVRQMSERLARAKAFALEAEELYDEVPEHSPRLQLSSTRRAALRRPDRLVGDASGDAVNRSFWYDGKVFAALDKEQNAWASGNVPATVDGALDWVFAQTGTVVPLADFLYADSYERLMGGVQRGEDPRHRHRGRRRPVSPPGIRAGHHRLAALDRCRQGPAAAQAGDYLQDRGRNTAVHGDHPEVEPRSASTGCAVRLHAA